MQSMDQQTLGDLLKPLKANACDLAKDGRGLNLNTIRTKAISRQLIQENDQLSDQDLASMIFKSGFSTAKSVSQSAGRGVGMDAILDMVRDVGGTVELILDPQQKRRHYRLLDLFVPCSRIGSSSLRP